MQTDNSWSSRENSNCHFYQDGLLCTLPEYTGNGFIYVRKRFPCGMNYINRLALKNKFISEAISFRDCRNDQNKNKIPLLGSGYTSDKCRDNLTPVTLLLNIISKLHFSPVAEYCFPFCTVARKNKWRHTLSHFPHGAKIKMICKVQTPWKESQWFLTKKNVSIENLVFARPTNDNGTQPNKKG